MSNPRPEYPSIHSNKTVLQQAYYLGVTVQAKMDESSDIKATITNQSMYYKEDAERHVKTLKEIFKSLVACSKDIRQLPENLIGQDKEGMCWHAEQAIEYTCSVLKNINRNLVLEKKSRGSAEEDRLKGPRYVIADEREKYLSFFKKIPKDLGFRTKDLKYNQYIKNHNRLARYLRRYEAIATQVLVLDGAFADVQLVRKLDFFSEFVQTAIHINAYVRRTSNYRLGIIWLKQITRYPNYPLLSGRWTEN